MRIQVHRQGARTRPNAACTSEYSLEVQPLSCGRGNKMAEERRGRKEYTY